MPREFSSDIRGTRHLKRRSGARERHGSVRDGCRDEPQQDGGARGGIQAFHLRAHGRVGQLHPRAVPALREDDGLEDLALAAVQRLPDPLAQVAPVVQERGQQQLVARVEVPQRREQRGDRQPDRDRERLGERVLGRQAGPRDRVGGQQRGLDLASAGLLSAMPSFGLVLTLIATECSDGMSDRVYPLTAKVEIGDDEVTGCAAPASRTRWMLQCSLVAVRWPAPFCTATEAVSTPATTWLQRAIDMVCNARWARPASAGTTPAPNRCGQLSSTNTTSGTRSPRTRILLQDLIITSVSTIMTGGTVRWE